MRLRLDISSASSGIRMATYCTYMAPIYRRSEVRALAPFLAFMQEFPVPESYPSEGRLGMMVYRYKHIYYLK